MKIGLIAGGVVLLGVIVFVIYKASNKWKKYYQF
jgi:hypothetical protein